ncbi:MAG: glycine zipper family protein [Deltaproteobacteria bacterium]|nr:glycine zipper family protein [Deltaproteobacteria bacterium]
MNRAILFVSFFSLILLAGCATIPNGPSVMVLPGHGKSFEEFQEDKCACEQWALQQTALISDEMKNHDMVNGAATGALLGAGIGAMLGAAAGDSGHGAAIGAGTGLLAGIALTAGASQEATWERQRRFDIAYQECMYSKGNQIPYIREPPQNAIRLPPPPPPPPRRHRAFPPP